MSFVCPECGSRSENPEDGHEGYCGHCHRFTLPDFLLDVAHTQEQVALLADGIVWEGNIQSCIAGTVVAVVRPAGMERPFEEKSWQLEDIEQMGRLDADPQEVTDDPLQAYARHLRDQARAHGELSLAEQLVQRHFDHREGLHGNSS